MITQRTYEAKYWDCGRTGCETKHTKFANAEKCAVGKSINFKKDVSERNKEIWNLVAVKGVSCYRVGRDFGLSQSRVLQIVKRQGRKKYQGIWEEKYGNTSMALSFIRRMAARERE